MHLHPLYAIRRHSETNVAVSDTHASGVELLANSVTILERHLTTPDDTKEQQRDRKQQVDQILLQERTLTLFGEINDQSAQATARALLALAAKSADPITLYISSPGGHVESGDVLFDLIQFVKPKVRIVGAGWVGSIAVHVYLAAAKNNRYCLPNTRFLIHQPAGGFGGTAADLAIHAREIVKIRERINRIIAERTGQPPERVHEDTNRDYWMSAEESVQYGLVGRIVSSVSKLN